MGRNEQRGDPPVSDAAYFDRWYSDMETWPAKDAILVRTLELPPDLGSGGVLPWAGVLEVVDGLHLKGGGLLADIACGRGGYGIEVARRCGATLVGVDFSAVALDHARGIAARRLPPDRAEFRDGTLTATGIPDHCADAVLCTDSVQFAEPPLAALLEFRRVLRPGGRLAVTTWQATKPGDERVGPRLRHLDLQRDLTEAGFLDVSVEDRPAWRAMERRMWEEVVATPNPLHDPALLSLQREGKRSLVGFDSLGRTVAFATAP